MRLEGGCGIIPSAHAGVMELVDVADSKSAGLIPRVGSSPTTGTIENTRFPGFGRPGFSCCFSRFSPVVLSYTLAVRSWVECLERC